MPIHQHVEPGTILRCNFDKAFKIPEMVKPRCVVVLSPKITARPGLATVVCLSTRPPDPVMPYHCPINLKPELPPPWDSNRIWVKGAMIYSIGFHRLDLLRLRKDRAGKRVYRMDVLTADQMKEIKSCVLRGLGMSVLTKHL